MNWYFTTVGTFMFAPAMAIIAMLHGESPLIGLIGIPTGILGDLTITRILEQ